MSFLEIDGSPESELPAHTNDGKRGDRASLLEGGLLHVKGGQATFARYRDVLGVVEHGDRVYVLVPRRPPSPPWMEIDAAMIEGGLAKFVERIEERGTGGGGYREAVRTRRQNLSPSELRERVMAREAVPGALEVPSTIMLGVAYPGLSVTQGAIFMSLGFCGFVAMEVLTVAAQMQSDPGLIVVGSLLGYAILIASVALGGWLAKIVGDRWKAAKNRTLPRQRVLVLAPDGCIAGFSSGVRTLSWSRVGRFTRGSTSSSHDALIVESPTGAKIGDLDAAWLDAPLPLVVKVAETYRQAAMDE